jgi:hypothetical protein
MNAVAPPSERIRAYLDGTLTEQERETFELALFDDPHLAEAVDAERLLRTGLREIEARRARPAVIAPAPAPLPARRFDAMYGFALAASLAVGVLIGAYTLRGHLPAAPTVVGGKTLFAGLSLSRSAPTDDVLIEVPADTPQLVLQFTRPQPADVRDYTLELELPDGTKAAFDHLLPATDTNLSVGLSAVSLPDGRYRARLVAVGTDGSRRDDQERHFVLKHVAPSLGPMR